MPADRRGDWDVHTHLVPASVVAAGGSGRYGMSIEGEQLVTPTLRVPLKRIVDPSALVKWIEENHLEGAMVSPPPPLYRPDMSDDDIGSWVGLVNEGMAETCADGPLRPLAYVPVERPRLAERVVARLDDRWPGVTLGTDLGSLVYSDPSFEPLWDTLESRNLPVFIHPGACPDVRLGDFYLTNLVGNPYETTVAAAHLVFGDVLGRHPDLRILLAHGGGAVAAVVGRWERGYDTSRPGMRPLTLTPREALSRFWVDSLVHDPSLLRHVTETFGVNSVKLGSDWPFPMGSDSLDHDREVLESASEGRWNGAVEDLFDI